MLNDHEIRKAQESGEIGIDPFDPKRVQPVSYDVSLSEDIRVRRSDVHTIDTGMEVEDNHRYYGLVPSWQNHTNGRTVGPTGYRLRPGEFILGCTEETIRLDSTMAARVEGKSSLGRLGLTVHITAGFVDPGFEGQITLEIANLAEWDIVLHPGMPIAQLVFERVLAPERDYSQTGRYQGQRGPTESRYRIR